jgi:hypothetical protein
MIPALPSYARHRSIIGVLNVLTASFPFRLATAGRTRPVPPQSWTFLKAARPAPVLICGVGYAVCQAVQNVGALAKQICQVCHFGV